MMESLRFELKGEEFHINGFPDAVAIVRVRSKKAKQLADMILHRADLEFALACIDLLKATSERSFLQEALWRSAVIHFIKCFGKSERRGQLAAKSVYAKAPDGSLDWFKYFDNLRNKHFVHDESSHAQCVVGAIINSETQDHKVAKIVGMQTSITTFSQERFDYLGRVVRIAHEWVVSHFDDLARSITNDLEAKDRSTLLGMEPLVFEKPTEEKMWCRDAP